MAKRMSFCQSVGWQWYSFSFPRVLGGYGIASFVCKYRVLRFA